MTTPCRHCHTTVRHTDTVGCCSGCSAAFSGLTAFDAHQSRGDDGRTICADPYTATDRKGRAVLALYGDQPTVAQAQAEALRQAARDWSDWDGLSAPEEWLARRADAIESGGDR